MDRYNEQPSKSFFDLHPLVYILLVVAVAVWYYVLKVKRQEEEREEKRLLEKQSMRNNIPMTESLPYHGPNNNLPTFSAEEMANRKQVQMIPQGNMKPRTLFNDPSFNPSFRNTSGHMTLSHHTQRNFEPTKFTHFEREENPYNKRQQQEQRISTIESDKKAAMQRDPTFGYGDNDSSSYDNSNRKLDEGDQYPSLEKMSSMNQNLLKKQFSNPQVPSPSNHRSPSNRDPGFSIDSRRAAPQSQFYQEFASGGEMPPTNKGLKRQQSVDPENSYHVFNDSFKRSSTKQFQEQSEQYESPTRNRRDTVGLERIKHDRDSPFKINQTPGRYEEDDDDDFGMLKASRSRKNTDISQTRQNPYTQRTQSALPDEPRVQEIQDYPGRRKVSIQKKRSKGGKGDQSFYTENQSEDKSSAGALSKFNSNAKRERERNLNQSRSTTKEIEEQSIKKKQVHTTRDSSEESDGDMAQEQKAYDKRSLHRKKTPIDISYLSHYSRNSSLQGYIARKTVADEHRFNMFEEPASMIYTPKEPIKIEEKKETVVAKAAEGQSSTDANKDKQSTSAGGLFGNKDKDKPAPTTAPSSGGDSKPAGGLFGNNSSSSSNSKPTGGDSAPKPADSNKTESKPQSGLFGNNSSASKPEEKKTDSAKPAGGLFGNNAKPDSGAPAPKPEEKKTDFPKPADKKPEETKTQTPAPAQNISGAGLFKTQTGGGPPKKEDQPQQQAPKSTPGLSGLVNSISKDNNAPPASNNAGGQKESQKQQSSGDTQKTEDPKKGSIFGNSTPSNSSSTGTGLFGQKPGGGSGTPATPNPSAGAGDNKEENKGMTRTTSSNNLAGGTSGGSGLFGNKTSNQENNSSSGNAQSNGNSTTTPPKSGLFGSNTGGGSSGIFKSNSATENKSSTPAPAENGGAGEKKGLFGNLTQSNSDSGSKPQGGLFGGGAQKSSLFGK